MDFLRLHMDFSGLHMDILGLYLDFSGLHMNFSGLSYACAMKQYTSRDMTSCNTAVNTVIRKIFGFKRWESVRMLWESFGYKSIYKIFARARNIFLESCKTHPNPVFKFIVSFLT